MLDFVLFTSPYVLQEGIARVVKGKCSNFVDLTRCKRGGVASSDSLVNQPCVDMVLFSEAEPTPLSSYLAVAKHNS